MISLSASNLVDNCSCVFHCVRGPECQILLSSSHVACYEIWLLNYSFTSSAVGEVWPPLWKELWLCSDCLHTRGRLFHPPTLTRTTILNCYRSPPRPSANVSLTKMPSNNSTYEKESVLGKSYASGEAVEDRERGYVEKPSNSAPQKLLWFAY